MKKFTKQLVALVLSLAMVMGLGLTSFAATITNNEQDTAVFNLTSTSANVQYTATKVEGGEGVDAEGNPETYPDVTTYSYYLEMPEGTANLSAVPINATFPQGYTLKIDGVAVTGNPYGTSLDFTTGTKTFVLMNGNQVVRTFVVSAGIKGTDITPVTVRLDIKNAVDWLQSNTDADVSVAVAALKKVCEMNGNGGMAAIPISGLKAGDTAMDATLKFLAEIGLKPSPDTANITYIAGIGAKNDAGQYVYLSQMDTEAWSGWLYLVKAVGSSNYILANYGAADYKLNGGEDIVWCFTNNFDDYQYLNNAN